MTEQRFYAACLASYNNGRLHGAWIDASADVEEMQSKVNAMLAASPYPNITAAKCDHCGHIEHYGDASDSCPECYNEKRSTIKTAEEWAIHDHEGLGDIGEYTGLNRVAFLVALQELADDCGIPLPVIADFAQQYCTADDVDDLKSEIDDRYHGEMTDAGDWAYDQAESMGYTVPDWIGCHVDWQGVARDWLMDYTQIDHDGTTYLFHAG